MGARPPWKPRGDVLWIPPHKHIAELIETGSPTSLESALTSYLPADGGRAGRQKKTLSLFSSLLLSLSTSLLLSLSIFKSAVQPQETFPAAAPAVHTQDNFQQISIFCQKICNLLLLRAAFQFKNTAKKITALPK